MEGCIAIIRYIINDKPMKNRAISRYSHNQAAADTMLSILAFMSVNDITILDIIRCITTLFSFFGSDDTYRAYLCIFSNIYIIQLIKLMPNSYIYSYQ